MLFDFTNIGLQRVYPDLGLNATSVIFGDEISSDVWEVEITYGSGYGGWTAAMLNDFAELTDSDISISSGVLRVAADTEATGPPRGLRFELPMRVDDVTYYARVPSGITPIDPAWFCAHLATDYTGGSGYPNPGMMMANGAWYNGWEGSWELAIDGSGNNYNDPYPYHAANTWYLYHGVFTNTTLDVEQDGIRDYQLNSFSVTRDYAHKWAFGSVGHATLGETDCDFGQIVVTGIIDVS